MTTIYEENSPSITYSSGWTRQFGSIYHDSGFQRTHRLNASASFNFRGSGIRLLGAQGWDHGVFQVDLDGQKHLIDGFCCGHPNPNAWGGGGNPQIIQFEAHQLDVNAKHTITVTNMMAGPKSSVLEIDAFIVDRPLIFDEKAPIAASVFAHLVVLFVLIFCAFVANHARRKLFRLAAAGVPSTNTILPTTTTRPRSPPPPPSYTPAPMPVPARVEKPVISLIDGVSSEMLAPTDNVAGSSSSSNVQIPQEYLSGLDDHLVEQVAQRVARLMSSNADLPPSYTPDESATQAGA